MICDLMRHAKTKSNRDLVYAGRNEEPILHGAVDDLKRAAEGLSMVRHDCVYTSPLRRTRMTAKVIADFLSLEVLVAPELVELDFGPWTGLTAEQISKRFPEQWKTWRADPFSARVSGMETLTEVQERVVSWLQRSSRITNRAVVVTHESVIKAVICRIDPRREQAYRRLTIENCSVTSIAVDDAGTIQRLC